MKNIIDYRNGAGGNTILAHILFACNKADTPLDNLSSLAYGQGNVHCINKHNDTNLAAHHYNETYFDKCNIVLEIKTRDWSELLRAQYSYTKWFQDYPTIDNYEKFFQFNFLGYKEAWSEFYNNYKDPSWPECHSYENRNLLPQHIQQEIKSVYQPVVITVTTDNFCDILQKTYSDMLTLCKQEYATNLYGSKLYGLENYYFDKNFGVLEEVAHSLGWDWNESRSRKFYNWVQTANKKSLIWLDQMKEQCYNNTNYFTLDWEIAYLNAMRQHIGEDSGKTI